MRTITYNLQQFLNESKSGAFVIPNFQRDFVWKDSQVRLLVDSIARNYPIGSLLLLPKTEDALSLSARPVNEVSSEVSADGGGDSPWTSPHASQPAVYYVLDGQQRLTSLVRVFLQSAPEKRYYFDLDKLLEFDSPDDPLSSWVIFRKPDIRLPSHYLRSDVVADSERCQVLVAEYFQNNKTSIRDNEPKPLEATAKVNRIFETIRNYQIPLVIIDRGATTEAVCRIFETINSTGMRLTTFDLAVARFFPEPDLRKLWNDSLRDHEVLKRYKAEGDRVLQVIAFLRGGIERKAYQEATRSALLELPENEISNKWEQAVKALSNAYEWAEEHGAVPDLLPQESLLVPLAFFLASVTDRWKQRNPGYNAVLERWYFANALQKGARASNYLIAGNVAQLRGWLSSDAKSPDIPTVTLTADDLLQLYKSDNRYRAIHSILRWKAGRDIWTEECLQPDAVEDHHIFPAALAKREKNLTKRLLDSIANRLLVSTRTNRTLGDRMPSDYMGELFREAKNMGIVGPKVEALRRACIPIPENIDDFALQFDQTQVKEFLEARANLLMDRLGSLLGNTLRRDPNAAEDDDESDDLTAE